MSLKGYLAAQFVGFFVTSLFFGDITSIIWNSKQIAGIRFDFDPNVFVLAGLYFVVFTIGYAGSFLSVVIYTAFFANRNQYADKSVKKLCKVGSH